MLWGGIVLTAGVVWNWPLTPRATTSFAADKPRPAAKVAHHGTGEANRIDAGVIVEPAILDGDDGVLEIGRDLIERHVMPLSIDQPPTIRENRSSTTAKYSQPSRVGMEVMSATQTSLGQGGGELTIQHVVRHG